MLCKIRLEILPTRLISCKFQSGESSFSQPAAAVSASLSQFETFETLRHRRSLISTAVVSWFVTYCSIRTKAMQITLSTQKCPDLISLISNFSNTLFNTLVCFKEDIQGKYTN